MPCTDPLLRLDRVECRYGDVVAISDVSFELAPGEVACLLGPSGCGKTTVLRTIAGFETVHGGSIHLAGRAIAGPGVQVPPDRRGVGMVFQDYALFPHLTAAENVAFGLRRRPRRERRQAADRLLELVGLAGMGARYPHELSGGQQQRVAVARAVAPHPPIILMDEPFSNLDVELRERLGQDIRRLLKEEGIAALFVTHDQGEAFLLGDSIGVMRAGHLLQWDTAFNLYHQPVNRFVADFIGQGRIIAGTLVAPGVVETELGTLRGSAPPVCAPPCGVDVLLRPDDLVLDQDGPVTAEVAGRAFKGAETLYTLRLAGGTEVLCEVPSRLDYPPGSRLRLRAEVEHLIVFPA
jgi:iron(III) transport system ATP-binding protein